MLFVISGVSSVVRSLVSYLFLCIALFRMLFIYIVFISCFHYVIRCFVRSLFLHFVICLFLSVVMCLFRSFVIYVFSSFGIS